MKYILIFIALAAIVGVATFMNKAVPEGQESLNHNVEENGTETETEVSYGKTLDLSGQGLNKTPEYVFSRTAIESLNLSNNNLEGSLQAEIRHLQNLRSLDLSNNNFTGLPAEIGQLKKLEVLNVSGNSLTGLPHELGNLSNLKLLDLTGNAYSQADLEKIREKLPASTVIRY